MKYTLVLIALFVYSPAEDFQFLPKHNDANNVVYRSAFCLEFSPVHKQARWVYYMLCRNYIIGKEIERGKCFLTDIIIKIGCPSPQDYCFTGYDRGHLAPAADFRWSKKAENECFQMSNIVPQTPRFNRGIWKSLEEQVRDWAVEYDTLFITTGGILRNDMKKIGKNTICVPDSFYKVILHYKPPVTKAIGFLMKNEGSKEPFKNFMATVDEVEKMTGIDFFSDLPDSIENEIESRIDFDYWKM